MSRIFTSLLFAFFCIQANAQKLLSEGSIVYDVSVQTNAATPGLADGFDGAIASVFIKGNLSRSEVRTALGNSTTIFDSRTGSGVVLREFGAQKLLIRLTKANWADKNKRYEGITFTRMPEKKVIAGYSCIRAIAKMKDGTTFSVFFTEEILTENKEYDAQFKDLPGIPLEFESVSGKVVIRYTANKISFDPIPVQRFDIPRSGYREMTYEEGMKSIR
jgi:GLPGLI family protein